DDRAVREFWKPRGNAAVGDCMPFFDGERWHLYYLVDRHAHRSKWGLGAHQWAHASTTDLVHWEHHPMAVPITDEKEGSICTGSVFLDGGEYRAWYAVRSIDGSPAPLGYASSRDGVHFTKSEWSQTLTAPYTGASARDPHVFQDPRDGLFHMLVTTSQADVAGNDRGCLAHLISRDLQTWKQQPPFIVPGLPGEPECCEWFEWNGWYYLVFSNGGIARYRMSRHPLGPWIAPAVSAFDGNRCNVMKSAPWHDHRRIGAAFLPRAGGGYAGNVVFRELVQQADGTLTTRFVPELMPKTGEPLRLQPVLPEAGPTTPAGGFVVRSDTAQSAIAFNGLPHDLHLTVRLRPAAGVTALGIAFRGADDDKLVPILRLLPVQRRIEVTGEATLTDVEGLGAEVALELYLKDDMLDVCLNGRRTLSSRVPPAAGDRLAFFSEGGETRVEALEVRPLVVAEQP
ncbi:MAG: glycosyl hydrolase, partial [Verrucomicrobiae bacterium]|nr:glycosyl hydrolase [Verrucomicrobiae bacterium]